MTETGTKTKKATAKKSNVVEIGSGLPYNELTFTDVYELLNYLQAHLNVKDNRSNSFGGFVYHNLKDIYASLKPLLVPIQGATLLPFKMTVDQVGERYYVKCEATLRYRNADGEVSEVTTYGMAEQGKPKAKMDESQMTGGATSYAQKYALDNMFMLDDNPTADYWNNGQSDDNQQPQNQAGGQLSPRAAAGVERCRSLGMTDEELDTLWKSCENEEQFINGLLEYYQAHTQQSA